MRNEEDGLTADELAALTAIAPFERWHLQWESSAREWVTAVHCPRCGDHLQYEVGALADFNCTGCGYDWLDDGPRELPIPASL